MVRETGGARTPAAGTAGPAAPGEGQNGTGKTLDLRRPFGGTVVLALLMAGLFLVAGELLLRQEIVSRRLPAASFGIGHQNLDLKFADLLELKKKGDLPTCVLLGASVVDTDIDPERFSIAIDEEAGLQRECYNFGIGALVLPSTLKLTRVIRDLFDPQLVVYGITPLDFEERSIRGAWRRSQARIEASPWLRYRLGEYSWTGWLIDHSWTYRYFLRFRQWMESPRLSDEVRAKERSSTKGFNNRRRFRGFKHDEKKVGIVRKKLRDFEVSPERVSLLGEIAEARAGRETVFAEAPLHPAVRPLFPRGEEDYRKVMNTVAARLGQLGVPLVRLEEGAFSREGLWRDYYHLNSMGALHYTDWLAAEVAAILTSNETP